MLYKVFLTSFEKNNNLFSRQTIFAMEPRAAPPLYSTRKEWTGGSVDWPPQSLDLNPLDFFWGHMKTLVHETPVNFLEERFVRFVVATDKIDATPEVYERV